MILHQFSLGDVEDPDIYAAQPLWEWQQTEKGKWVMEHGHGLTYTIQPSFVTYGYTVTVVGDLNPEDKTYFTLKYK